MSPIGPFRRLPRHRILVPIRAEAELAGARLNDVHDPNLPLLRR